MHLFNHSNKHNRKSRSTITLLALLTLIIPSALSRADDEVEITNGSTTLTAERITINTQDQDISDTVFSLKFSGGNAAEYIQTIQHQVPQANIVIMPDVDKIQIPPLKLTSVNLDTALSLLNDQIGEDNNYRYSIESYDARTDRISNPVFVVRTVKKRIGGFGNQSREITSKVWAVDPLLKVLSSDDILAAIDVALPLSVDEKPDVEIRFHKETGLLIARGGEQELRMIDQLLSQLYDTAANRAELDERERHIDELENQNMELHERMQQIKPEMEEWRTHIEEQKQMIQHLQEALKEKEEITVVMQNKIESLMDKMMAMQKELQIHRDKP